MNPPLGIFFAHYFFLSNVCEYLVLSWLNGSMVVGVVGKRDLQAYR